MLCKVTFLVLRLKINQNFGYEVKIRQKCWD